MRGELRGLDRRMFVRWGWAMLAAAVLITGCAGTERSSDAAGAVGAATRDYGTLVERTPRAELLTLDEIRPFLVLGFDIRKQPLLDPTLFDLQTLRGPCGTPVTTPFSPTKGFIVYRSTETLTLEAIAEPGDVVADQFVAALAADEHDGCPPFTESLGGRSTQTSFARSFSLTDLGIHQVGYEQRHAGGSYAHRFVMVVAGGGRVTLLIVLSNDALLPENLHPVLAKAITGR